jgi:hypothetical protein
MGDWKRWLPTVVAAGLVLAGLFALDWWSFPAQGGRLTVDLRGATICVADVACISVPLRPLGGSFATLAAITFWVGLWAALALLAVSGVRALGGDVAPTAMRGAIGLCAVLVPSALITIVVFPPEATGGLHLGGWATLVGGVAGPIGVYLGAERAEPAAAAAVAAPALEAATPSVSVRIARSPIELDGADPAPAASAPARPRVTLPHSVRAAQLGDAGLVVQLDRGGERRVGWDEITLALVRAIPVQPEPLLFVDLVTAAGPVRVMSNSQVDYDALPGGASATDRDNLRRLVALARHHHPALVVEDESAAFFAAGREPPSLPTKAAIAAHDARYA